MLAAGSLVVKAKAWRGWRSAAPFVCGLALPAFFAVGPLAGSGVAGYLFAISTAVSFTLPGYAVRPGNRAPS